MINYFVYTVIGLILLFIIYIALKAIKRGIEAKNKNINAFCLTVDKTGHDYLKTMCQDMAYEVLDDIHILPERLLYLYRRLTT